MVLMSLGVSYGLKFHLIIVCKRELGPKGFPNKGSSKLPVVNFHYVLHAQGYGERGGDGGKRGQCILKET